MYRPLEYKEHDFNEAPKFTAPLNDRATTVGYSTKLLCAVRGSPKVGPHIMKVSSYGTNSEVCACVCFCWCVLIYPFYVQVDVVF